jgi:hypothetical protein
MTCPKYQPLPWCLIVTLLSILAFTSVFAGHAAAQTDANRQDCEEFKKQIAELQDELAKLAAQIQSASSAVGILEKGITRLQEYLKSKSAWAKFVTDPEVLRGKLLEMQAERLRLKRQIEQDKDTIQAIKDLIADLLNKLGDCGKNAPPPNTQPTPTPTPSPNTPTPAPSQGRPSGVSQTQPTLGMLVASGKVKIDSTGTGETIGHVADLKIQNLTDQPINCVIPPMVLESKGRKNQDYVCAKPQTAKIPPHGTTNVPMNGVCVNRSKPPVGKGASGDLILNTGDPSLPQDPGSHILADQARDLLSICTAKYDAADKLQQDGALKDLPYKDKQKQKDIVVQWSTWCDPRISQITGAPPATKDDLKKVVYKQVEENGPMSSETKKKVDQGIDTIFEKIELTTAKAKDLEKPEAPAGETTPAESPPSP